MGKSGMAISVYIASSQKLQNWYLRAWIYIYIWCPEFEITYFILVKSVRFLKSPCKRHALQWYVLEPFIQAAPRQNPSFCWTFNYSWIWYVWISMSFDLASRYINSCRTPFVYVVASMFLAVLFYKLFD